MHRVIWVPVFQVEPRKYNRRNSALKSSGADGDCEVKGSEKMKRDQHADTFQDEEAYVKILREVGLVEELDGRWRMATSRRWVQTRGVETRRAATTRRDGSRPGHTRNPEKAMRVRFGGVTRPVDLWHGTGGTLEKATKEKLGIPTKTETHVMADGRVLNWTEAERLEDGETVEVMVPMKRGSRKRNAKKGRKREIPGILVARRKSGRRRGERRRGRMGESYQGGVERVGEEFHATGMKSRNMAARAKREKREEMVGVRDVPVLGVETAVVKIVWMVEERAREREEERNQKLWDEKDWVGFFGRYSKLHDRFGSRNLHGKMFP